MNITANPQVAPEVHAYAMARYSRSARSMADSIADITEQQAAAALDRYYNEYGHASIADMAHVSLAIENVSLLAAIDIVDEPLWDGQERSTRYQDFGKEPEVYWPGAAFSQHRYVTDIGQLFYAYDKLATALPVILERNVPKPDSMSSAAYHRALKARAFDVARQLLPLATKTSLGQITSARTLASQIRRLRASDCAEIRQVADGMRAAGETVAPTLLRHCEPDRYSERLEAIITECVGRRPPPANEHAVHLITLDDWPADTLTLATATYQMADQTFDNCCSAMDLLLWRDAHFPTCANDLCQGCSGHPLLMEEIAAARGPHDPLPRWFQSAPFAFDILTDIGAYRDLHRHRRCIQFRQPFSALHGFEPAESVFRKALGPAAQAALDAGLGTVYDDAIEQAHRTYRAIAETSPEAATYLLPLATRCRSLFKMDLAEAVYITELRTKPQGHYSYRWIAWEMAQAVIARYPEFAPLFRVTDPNEFDLLAR